MYLDHQTILQELWSAVYFVLSRQRVPHSVAVVVDSECFGLDQKTTRQTVAVDFADCFGQHCQTILQTAAADFVVDLCPQKGFDLLVGYWYSAMSQIVHPRVAYSD